MADDIVYIVCSTTGASSTSESNSNKFHKWVKRGDGMWDHTWGRVGAGGQSAVDTEAKMKSKLASSLKPRGDYERVAVAADAGSGSVNGGAMAQQEMRKRAIDQLANGDADIAALVTMLVDRNTREIQGSTSLKYDAATGLFKTDAGIIVTKEVIDEARGILATIQGLVGAKKKVKGVDPDDVTCRYLMRIPTNIGRDRPTFDRVFPDTAAIDKQTQILDGLVASLDMLAKPKPAADPNAPAVAEPRIWNASLMPVDAKELARIAKKFFATAKDGHAAMQAGLKPKRAWNLSIEHMDKAFADDGAKVGTIHELWHGTRVGNLLSILAKGLIIPPWADAGRMFGDGLYLAPNSTKSLNYSYGAWDSRAKDLTCYMLLVDAGVGKFYTPKSYTECSGWKTAKKGHDSTWAKGGYSGVANDEVIVYRASQAKVTRLIEFAA